MSVISMQNSVEQDGVETIEVHINGVKSGIIQRQLGKFSERVYNVYAVLPGNKGNLFLSFYYFTEGDNLSALFAKACNLVRDYFTREKQAA